MKGIQLVYSYSQYIAMNSTASHYYTFLNHR